MSFVRLLKKKPKYLIIDGCPVPYMVAPYVHELLLVAGQSANSIYRGTDAAKQLGHYGKHDQAWLYANLPAGQANPPGQSTHELYSDGVAYPHYARGERLPETWMVGVDSGSNTLHDRQAIQHAATHLGYDVFHPYAAGVEMHHWNFRTRPKSKNPAKIIWLRTKLVGWQP